MELKKPPRPSANMADSRHAYRKLQNFLRAQFRCRVAFCAHQDVDGAQIGAAVQELLYQYLAHEPGGPRHQDRPTPEEFSHLAHRTQEPADINATHTQHLL